LGDWSCRRHSRFAATIIDADELRANPDDFQGIERLVEVVGIQARPTNF
jgi:hypothetical protein